MGMTKLSVTVEDELADEMRERAGNRGISAFVNQAVRHELQLGRLGALLADLENELGPPDEDMVIEALASLDRVDAKQPAPVKRRSTER
jgi:Arc/MetJ family transcription regulator